MPRALKVYRTAIGFHDAYVAAPSQKAALAAWGTDKNLFARGAAEIVSDPVLMKAPLARAGQVIQVVRGSAADHVKALGKGERPKARSAPTPQRKQREAKPKRPPKPSREALRLARQGMRRAAERAVELLADLAKREKALAAERRRLTLALSAEKQRQLTRLRQAEKAYEDALADWSRG
ncbi:hypothetical protein [Novosphingobium sp. Gsoil 351]|uniref:hypothetical protein n=1 Tax=Novosphingobium sp. Gsoil 351 TaxID=2675225 RepID=UPI0012B4A190|nr:hypothetical protein [Novosphingobium sp. Gsoil 351]QGN54958.1 hypothetical protein GKE62_10740 [Novosphingobium sp. Gsoil 351]